VRDATMQSSKTNRTHTRRPLCRVAAAGAGAAAAAARGAGKVERGRLSGRQIFEAGLLKEVGGEGGADDDVVDVDVRKLRAPADGAGDDAEDESDEDYDEDADGDEDDDDESEDESDDGGDD